MSEGKILRAQRQAVASVVAASRRTMRIAGHVVPVANVPPSMASDAGHLLCQVCDKHPCNRCNTANSFTCCAAECEVCRKGSVPPFAATYYDGADGRRHFSLRSPEGGTDVGVIAKSLAKRFNQPLIAEHIAAIHDASHGTYLDACPECAAMKIPAGPFAGGGHAHAAGFDAPLGWEGE